MKDSETLLTQFEFETSPLPPPKYRNNVYISLNSLTVSKSYKSSKSIGVEVRCLMNDDQSPDVANGLSVFSNGPQGSLALVNIRITFSEALLDAAMSAGYKHGSSSIQFIDDFWVPLPLNLTKEHLVFHFFRLDEIPKGLWNCLTY